VKSHQHVVANDDITLSIITFHMDDVYGQHIYLYLLTKHIEFATRPHYLQLCYIKLQNAMCQHNNFKQNIL
jgi:hypothetical protein